MSAVSLIDQLTADLRPASSTYVIHRLLTGVGVGAASSLALVTVSMGLRPDMPGAALTMMFWVKLGYVLVLATVALWSAERFARPAANGWLRAKWISIPVLIMIALAALQLLRAPPLDREAMIVGGSAARCACCIVVLAAPPLTGLIWAMRGLAPTRLSETGSVIGVAAGGVGAGAYALHCTESTAPFIAIWYTLGVTGAALAGAVLGPSLLRWR